MKKRTRLSLFTLVLVLMFSLQAFVAQAAIGDSLTRTLDVLEDPLVWLWEVFPVHPSFPVIIKTLYFFILFSLLYNGAMFGLRAQVQGNNNLRRAIIILTLVMSIIASWGMPIDWLLTIFAWNTAILSIAFAMLFPLCMFFIARRAFPGDDNGARLMRGLLYILLGVFIIGMSGYILDNPTGNAEIYESLLSWIQIMGVVALIAGIFTLFMGFGGGAVAGRGWQGVRNLVGRGNQANAQGAGGAAQQAAPGAPQNPQQAAQQLNVLQTNMALFVQRVGQPGVAANTVVRRVLAVQQEIRRTITNAPDDATRRANAQAALAACNRIRDDLTELRTMMNDIIINPQYGTVPDPERVAFETHIQHFLVAEGNFTAAFIEVATYL
jgi:hypothetical protein